MFKIFNNNKIYILQKKDNLALEDLLPMNFKINIVYYSVWRGLLGKSV